MKTQNLEAVRNALVGGVPPSPPPSAPALKGASDDNMASGEFHTAGSINAKFFPGAKFVPSFWSGNVVAQVGTGPQVQQRQITRYIQDLKSSDDASVERAILDLVAIGPAAVLPLLTCMSRSGSVKDRDAAKALGVIMRMGPVAVPALVEAALKHPNRGIRQEAALMLTGPLGTDAVPALVPKLQDPDVNVRRVTVRILAQTFNDSQAEPARITALMAALKNDQDATVRENAAQGMGRVPDGASIEPARAVTLIAALKNDPDAKVREASARSLGMIDAPAAIPALIDVLNDDHETANVRAAAAWALGRMKADAAGPALMAALTQNQNNQSAPVRAAAAWALGELRWFGNTSPICGAKAVFSSLTAGLKDPSPDVRKESALALEHIHTWSSQRFLSTCSAASETLVPPLINALNNPQNAEAREAAASAIRSVTATFPWMSQHAETGLKALDRATRRGLIKRR